MSNNVAIAAIIEHNGMVLVGKKITTEHVLSGAWLIPGGKVQFGETEEEALIREMKEEANINIRVEKFIDERFVPEANIKVKWYLCFPLTRNIKPGDDLAEVKFVPKGEILRICDPKAVFLWPPKVTEYFKS